MARAFAIKSKYIIPLVFTFVLIGCGGFKQSGDQFSLAFYAILPDPCEVDLFGIISDFRYLNNRFPEKSELSELKGTLSSECQERIELTKLTEYETDSMDVFYLIKHFVSDTEHVVSKAHRLSFEHDTLSKIDILTEHARAVEQNED